MTLDNKLERMLLSFEEKLPNHEVGRWLIWVQPNDEIVLDMSDGRAFLGKSDYRGILLGCGQCLLCGQRFEFKQLNGNFCVHHESEQERLARDYPTLTTAYKIEEMKKLIQKSAEDSGKCWGKVPVVPFKDHSYARLEQGEG